jgi:hypothetical protein
MTGSPVRRESSSAFLTESAFEQAGEKRRKAEERQGKGIFLQNKSDSLHFFINIRGFSKKITKCIAFLIDICYNSDYNLWSQCRNASTPRVSAA